jgi:hypothetical protein
MDWLENNIVDVFKRILLCLKEDYKRSKLTREYSCASLGDLQEKLVKDCSTFNKRIEWLEINVCMCLRGLREIYWLEIVVSS